MFAGILRFELRYHMRQVTFLAATVAVALGGFMLVSSGYGPAGVPVNSPYVVMQSLGLLSLMSVFVLTIFCANAALRDFEHGMTELVFVKPVGKPRYLWGRFLGALLAGLVVMAMAALIMMLAPLVVTLEPERIGAIQPAAYGWALLIMVLPNLVLVSALLFAVATLSRSTLATYVGAVAIYALYLVCALLVDSPLMAGASPPTPEALARAALLDPFGLSAFFEQTRYWPASERAVRMVSLSGRMLLNRLLWLGVAAAVFAVTYRAFQFRVGVGRAKAARRAARAEAAPGTGYRPVAPAWGGGFRIFRSALRLELRHVLRGWSFLALLALWVFLAGSQAVAQLSGGDYGTRILPTTGALIAAMRLPLLLIGSISIVYYAAEIAWRERAVKIHTLVDATPQSSAIFYLAKACALCALPLILTLVAILVGLLVQAAHGYTDFQPGLYLSLLGTAALPLALFGIGALALQVLAPNRWLGLLAGLALALVARLGEGLGIEHPMLRYSAAPALSFSEMSGFDGSARTFAAFMLYWSAAAALLACLSWGFWPRGLDTGIPARSAAALASWGRSGRNALRTALAALGVIATLLYWQTNVVHGWQGSAEAAEWQAGYERSYRRIAQRAQPSIVAVRTTVDLYPEDKRARIEGTFTLENRSTAVIDSVWVSLPLDAKAASAEIAGARTQRDSVNGMQLFQLAQPLGPGGRTELRFSLELDRSGIRAEDPVHDIAGNGSFITNRSAYPTIGYRSGYEIGDVRARREQGLTEPASAAPDLDTLSAGGSAPNQPWLTVDATVSTAGDQTAFATGQLLRQWGSGGRRYFHYRSAQPVTPLFAIVSGRYAVERVQHGGVAVEVWYHPAHRANVARMLAAATRSLDLLSARFGRYPHDHLRIIETPAWSNFGAFALPGHIYFRETGGFLTDAAGQEVDLITRRTAHEVSHQWWAHTLDPADIAGASTLIETLAKYSEQVAVSDLHGRDALFPLLAFDEDRYLAGRALEARAEPTLMNARGQEYMYYGKGALVMNGLRDLLGEPAVDRALARLALKHGGSSGAATTVDLRAELRAEAQSSLQLQLLNEWLGQRTLYDFRVDTAELRSIGGGRYRVNAQISAEKIVSAASAESAQPLTGERIDVAVLDAGGKRLYEGKHIPVNGRIALAVETGGIPALVVVDPEYRRIDRTRSNNRRRLLRP